LSAAKGAGVTSVTLAGKACSAPLPIKRGTELKVVSGAVQQATKGPPPRHFVKRFSFGTQGLYC
jgi:hypothetical protein